MALSRVQYTGTGTSSLYSIPFAYISKAYIEVRVGGALLTEGVGFTWQSPTSINLTAGNLAAGVVLDIKRRTPKTSKLVDFQDGSVLTEASLDLSADQVFQLVQETVDDMDDRLAVQSDGTIDGQSRRIKNVADPVEAQDAVTKNWTETAMTSQLVQATTKASQAASSESAAAASASDAAASAVLAASYSGGVLGSNNTWTGTNTWGQLSTFNANAVFNRNVGIGSAPGSYKLSVTQVAPTHAVVSLYNADTTSTYNTDLQLNNANVVGNALLSRRTSGEFWMYTSAAHPIAFWTNGAERMRIDSAGNVGIGGTPGHKLDVFSFTMRLHAASGNGAGYVQYGSSATATNNWHVGSEGDGTFRWWNGVYGSGTERMRIDGSGNVGVGAVPVYKLHVQNDSAGATTYVGVKNATATGAVGAGYLAIAGASTYYSMFAETANGDMILQNVGPAAGVITFSNNGAERLRIGGAGQLGVAGANYGTSGQVLTSNGAAAAPSWQSINLSSYVPKDLGAGSFPVGTIMVVNTGSVVSPGATFTSGSAQHNSAGIVGTWRNLDSANTGLLICQRIA